MQNKKIVILVGSNGEVANILLENTDLNKYSLIKTSSKIYSKDTLYCDLKSKDSIDNFLNEIKHMKIFLLTLNASITPKYYKNINNLDFNLLKNMFLINCASLIYFIEKINELKIDIKKILIISSLSAYFPSEKHLAYNATKSAQLSIFNSLRQKYLNKKINIFLLSSKNKKLDNKKLSLEYKKLLNKNLQNSKIVNFSLMKTFIFFLKKVFKY